MEPIFCKISNQHNNTSFKRNNKESVFIYTNDTHGNLNNLPYLVTGINSKQNELSKKHPITLSSGDDLMYSNFINKKLEPIRKGILIDILNKLNLTAATIGNHEINGGLASLSNLMKKAKFKFVSANTKIKGTPLEEREKDGELVKSMIYKNKNGLSYGIIGVSPIDEFSSEIYSKSGDFIAGKSVNYYGTPEEIKEAVDVRYNNTMNAISGEVKNLSKKHINKIILLSHLGYEKDRQIVNDPRINGVDIILGGHSHDELEGFVYDNKNKDTKQNVFKTPEGKPIIVTQAGSNANKFGVLDVNFDKHGILETNKTGEIKGYNNLFNTKDYTVTPQITKFIDNAIKKNFKNTKHIGTLDEPIEPITTRDKENTLITATMDGFLDLADKKGTDDIKNLDFAMMNASTIRAGLPKGELNDGTLSLSFVFAVPMSKVMASEKQIVDTMNYTLQKGDKKGAYDIPQFSSNVKYELSDNKNENGNRTLKLSKLSINGKDVNLQKPDEEKKYRAAIRDIYADTNYFGDAFNSSGKPIERCTDKDGKPLDYIEGLADYLRKNCVDPKTDKLTFDTIPHNISVVKNTSLINDTKDSISNGI